MHGVAEELEWEVDWITAGAVGEPGARTFYLQARTGTAQLTLVVEKTQVAALAEFAQELLGRVDTAVTPDDLNEEAQRLEEPLEPLWRVGSLGLGMDSDGERFVLEAAEFSPEDAEQGATARFWMSREQLVALVAHAAWAVEAGARERCRLCNRPIDPATGHVCPASNGHGRLTV